MIAFNNSTHRFSHIDLGVNGRDHIMELALFTAVPFCLALLLAAPFVRTPLNKSSQTVLTSLVFAALFRLAAWHAAPGSRGGRHFSDAHVDAFGGHQSFFLFGWTRPALWLDYHGNWRPDISFSPASTFDDAQEHNRFIIWLSAFAGAMLAVVLSGNVLMMFIAWELTSITSFISDWLQWEPTTRPRVTEPSKRSSSPARARWL